MSPRIPPRQAPLPVRHGRRFRALTWFAGSVFGAAVFWLLLALAWPAGSGPA